MLRDLRTIGHALGDRYGAHDPSEFPVDRLMLPVEVRLGPRMPIDETAVAQLVDGLRVRVSGALKSQVAFEPGRVYCFLCDEPCCVHSAPQKPAETFVGYRPTGKPVWQTFTTLCMERREPRVDRLFGERPEIIALVQTAGALKDGLLPGFGRESLAYNVLGQVVIGLLPPDLNLGGRDDSGGARVALTLQVVETRSGVRSRRVRMNLIGMTLDDIAVAAERSAGRGPAESLRRTIRTTRERLASIERRLETAERRGEEMDLDAALDPVLNRLKGDVERVFRPLQRRTHHAQERHLSGERPTSQAVSDAASAANERFFYDTVRNTVVVLGPKGRAHVFTSEARHVTSLQLSPGELERKTERKRWRLMPRQDAAGFRSTLQARE